MNIKKAVIAAAGKGTRFLPLTKAYQKELIAIMDKPIIQIHVEELICCGIKEICIVHRPNDNQIQKYFDQINLDAKIYFVEQTDNLPYALFSDLRQTHW